MNLYEVNFSVRTRFSEEYLTFFVIAPDANTAEVSAKNVATKDAPLDDVFFKGLSLMGSVDPKKATTLLVMP